jgi:O-antigen/teichoic acid export membrane protein
VSADEPGRGRTGWRGLAGHRFVGDTATLQAGQVVAVAAQAATSLVALRVLGPELLGLYALSIAFVATIGLLDAGGSNRVALLELARAEASRTREATAAALAGHLRINVQLGGLVVLAFAIAAPHVSSWAYGRADVGGYARWLALPVLLDVPFAMLGIVRQGRRQMRPLVGMESARAIAASAAGITALAAGLGVAGLVGARVVASAAASLWAVRAYARLARRDGTLPSWRRLIVAARRTPLLPRVRIGITMSAEKNLGNLGAQLPVLLMGALSPAAVGYYNAALRVVSLPYPLLTALARNLDAALPFRAARGGVRGAFLRTSLAAGLLWTGVTAVMAVAAPIALVRLGGEAYAPAVPAIYPLLLQSIAVGAGVGIAATLRAIDRVAYGMALQLASIAVAVPLGLALIPSMGAVGGAWTMALRFSFLTVVGISLAAWLAGRAPHAPRVP